MTSKTGDLRAQADALIAANTRALRGAFDLDRPAPRQWWNLPAKVKRLDEIRKEGALRLPGEDNAVDALRHGQGARQAALEVGTGWARLGGVVGEIARGAQHGVNYAASGVGVPTNERPRNLREILASAEMDLHNNEVGFRAAAEGRPVDLRDLQTAPRGRSR